MAALDMFAPTGEDIAAWNDEAVVVELNADEADLLERLAVARGVTPEEFFRLLLMEHCKRGQVALAERKAV